MVRNSLTSKLSYCCGRLFLSLGWTESRPMPQYNVKRKHDLDVPSRTKQMYWMQWDEKCFAECHCSDKSRTQYGINSIDGLWQLFTPPYGKVFFFCGIHWNLTDSSISETSTWNRKSSDQYRYRIEAEIQYWPYLMQKCESGSVELSCLCCTICFTLSIPGYRCASLSGEAETGVRNTLGSVLNNLHQLMVSCRWK